MPKDPTGNSETQPPGPSGAGTVAVEGALPAGVTRQRRLFGPLLLIILASTVVDVLFFTGFYASDDIEYLSGARQILQNGSLGDEPTLGQKRLTLVSWNLLIAALFGYRVQVIAGSYILFHQLANVLTFLLARRFFDRTVGLAAAYTAGLFPVLVVFASQILPDILLACCVLLSLLMFIQAYDLREAKRGRASWLLMFVAGVAVGLGYLTKESGLLLLPYFFVLWLLLEARHFRWQAAATGCAFALGFFIVFVGEYAALSFLTGKPFFRLGWTCGTSEISPWIVRKVEMYATPTARARWMLEETHSALFPTPLKIAFLASLPIYPFLRGNRHWTVLILALWLFGYSTWGSMNFSRYLPPTIQARYYIVVVPLAVIMYAAVAVWLFRLCRKLLPWNALARPLSVGGVMLLTVPLLCGLGGPDAFAANSYWSHLGNSTNRALAFALSQSDRPIVLSAAIEVRLRELLLVDPPSRIRLASDMTEEDLVALADMGGFYYLEIDRNSPVMKVTGRMLAPAACLADEILHAAAWNNVTDGRVSVRKLGQFNSWTSRWDVLRLHLFQSLNPDAPPLPSAPSRPIVADIRVGAAQRHKTPTGGLVCLYEVTSAMRGPDCPLAGFRSSAIALTDASPRGDRDNATAGITDWRVTGSDHYQWESGQDGSAIITLDLPDGERLQLTPTTRTAPSPWILSPGRMNVVCVRAELDDGVRAQWLLRGSDPSRTEEQAGNWEELRNGVCLALAIKTQDTEETLEPQITLSGTGCCRLQVCILSAKAGTTAADALLRLAAGLSSIVQVPFRTGYAKDGITAVVPGWRVPVQHERVSVSAVVRERARITFDLPEKEFIWVLAEKRMARRSFCCPPHGTLLIGIALTVTGSPLGRLAGPVYPDAAMLADAVAEARFPIRGGRMMWFVVDARDEPLYFRPVFKIMGQGSISVERCIVFSGATRTVPWE